MVSLVSSGVSSPFLQDARGISISSANQNSLEDSRDAVTVAWQPERFYLSAEGYVFWLAGGELPGVNSPIAVTLSYESMEDVSVYG